MAGNALVEPLARVRGHALGPGVTAMWASQRRLQDQRLVHHPFLLVQHLGRARCVQPGATASIAFWTVVAEARAKLLDLVAARMRLLHVRSKQNQLTLIALRSTSCARTGGTDATRRYAWPGPEVGS